MRRVIFEPEHEQFRDSVRHFMRTEIAPHGERWRKAGMVDREAYIKAGGAGLLCTWAEPTDVIRVHGCPTHRPVAEPLHTECLDGSLLGGARNSARPGSKR